MTDYNLKDETERQNVRLLLVGMMVHAIMARESYLPTKSVEKELPAIRQLADAIIEVVK